MSMLTSVVFLCVSLVLFVVVMGVFMLPITVKSNYLFSTLDSSSRVIPLIFVDFQLYVAINCMHLCSICKYSPTLSKLQLAYSSWQWMPCQKKVYCCNVSHALLFVLLMFPGLFFFSTRFAEAALCFVGLVLSLPHSISEQVDVYGVPSLLPWCTAAVWPSRCALDVDLHHQRALWR